MAETKNKIILAYTAGIIDGEGCLSIHKTHDKRGLDIRERYTNKLIVVSTDKPMVDFLKENFGGGISFKKSKNINHLNQYAWQIGGKKAIEIVKLVYPYLIIKKRQADVFIEYEKTIVTSQYRMTDEIREMRIKLFNRIKSYKNPIIQTINWKNGWGVTRFAKI